MATKSFRKEMHIEVAKENGLTDAQLAKAYQAAERILANLKTSDFVTECGQGAVRTLAEYKLDMAVDIAKEYAL